MMKIISMISLLAWLITAQATGQTQVIAHRGYWDKAGAAQNSKAAIQNALDLNIYGAETDIWLTADGHLMVNHDATYNGVALQTATYDQCKRLTLSNGEKMPELKDFLQMMKTTKSKTKLIIEIKKHDLLEANIAAAQATIKAVNEYGVANKVEYISFSIDACKELVRCNPQANVAYLNGDMAPAELANDGIRGIDYKMSVLRDNPQWVAEAHQHNMKVNVWTVNKAKDMREMKSLGVDFITTNKPLEAMKECGEQ